MVPKWVLVHPKAWQKHQKKHELFAPFIIQCLLLQDMSSSCQPLEVFWQRSLLHSFNFQIPASIFPYSLLVTSPTDSSISQTCGQCRDKRDGSGPHYHTIRSPFSLLFHFPGWFFKVLVRGDNNNSLLGLEDVWSERSSCDLFVGGNDKLLLLLTLVTYFI
jgi:hypothetical protein